MRKNTIIRIALVTAFILLLPLLAMQFTDEVVWGLADFIIAGVLIFGTGLAYELVVRKGGTTTYRAAIGMGLATTLFLIWVNLAVGLIGSEDNPANALYIGVLIVGIIGTSIARFRPRPMMYTLLAMAVTQALVPFIALLIWSPPINFGVVQVLGVNALFVALFVGSAMLFRGAGTTDLKGM